MIAILITCLINFMVRGISCLQIPHRWGVIDSRGVRQLFLSFEDSTISLQVLTTVRYLAQAILLGSPERS